MTVATGREARTGDDEARSGAATGAGSPAPWAGPEFAHALAQLRHLHAHLANGTFTDARELARGLLSPQIAFLERLAEGRGESTGPGPAPRRHDDAAATGTTGAPETGDLGIARDGRAGSRDATAGGTAGDVATGRP